MHNITILKKKYKCKVGLSDHSKKNIVGQNAVALGAEVIEKHLAIFSQKSSLDYDFSSSEKNFGEYVSSLKEVHKLVEKNFFYRNKNEKINLKFRRSIYAVKDIKKNEKFKKKNIKIIRPGYGLDPYYFEKLINKKSPINIKAETPLKKIIFKN